MWSAALNLAERGFDVVLLEAERIGWGASGRNGGLIGSGQRKDALELEEQFGYEQSRALWDIAEEAKADIFGLGKVLYEISTRLDRNTCRRRILSFP